MFAAGAFDVPVAEGRNPRLAAIPALCWLFSSSAILPFPVSLHLLISSLFALSICFFSLSGVYRGAWGNSWGLRLGLRWRREVQGRWCIFTCFVHRDNPWKPAFVIRTVPCNATYLPTLEMRIRVTIEPLRFQDFLYSIIQAIHVDSQGIDTG